MKHQRLRPVTSSLLQEPNICSYDAYKCFLYLFSMPNLRSVNLWGQTVLAAVVALVLGMLLGGALQRYEQGPVADKDSSKAENSSLFDASDSHPDEVELGTGWQEEAEPLSSAPEGAVSGASSASSAAVGD